MIFNMFWWENATTKTFQLCTLPWRLYLNKYDRSDLHKCELNNAYPLESWNVKKWLSKIYSLEEDIHIFPVLDTIGMAAVTTFWDIKLESLFILFIL